MSSGIQGVSALDLEPGDYVIEPSEWRRDVGQQLSNLTSGSGEGDEPIWHIHNVEGPDGSRVMEVVEDRRAMEGLQTSGRQFLFRSPDGEPLMAFEREGYAMGTTTTLEDLVTEEVLGSWEASGLLSRMFMAGWEFADPRGDKRAKAKREWSLGSLLYPSFDLTSVDGTDIGRFSVERDGMFHRADVTLKRSAIPIEVVLAMSYGIFWAVNQS